MRELAQAGRLTECWIPPTHIADMRPKVRLYKTLTGQRRAGMQRIHATVFHQGVPPIGSLTTRAGCSALAEGEPVSRRPGCRPHHLPWRTGFESVRRALAFCPDFETPVGRRVGRVLSSHSGGNRVWKGRARRFGGSGTWVANDRRASNRHRHEVDLCLPRLTHIINCDLVVPAEVVVEGSNRALGGKVYLLTPFGRLAHNAQSAL